MSHKDWGICKNCKGQFYSQNKNFCSRTCYFVFARGENSPNFKGDLIKKVCRICQKEFRLSFAAKQKKYPTQGRGRFTCSPHCARLFVWSLRKSK